MAKSVQYQNPYLIDLLVCLVKKKVGAADELKQKHFVEIGGISIDVDSVKHFFVDKHLISGDTNINTYYFATKKTLDKYCEYIGEVDWKTFCNTEKETSLSFEPDLSTKSATTEEARLCYYKFYEKNKANIQKAVQSHEKIQIARKREYEIVPKLDKIQETSTPSPINFNLFTVYRSITESIKKLNQEFEEIKEKIANLIEGVIEPPTDQIRDLSVALLVIDGQRSTQEKELLNLEADVIRLANVLDRIKDAPRLLKVRKSFEQGNLKEIAIILNLPEEWYSIEHDDKKSVKLNPPSGQYKMKMEEPRDRMSPDNLQKIMVEQTEKEINELREQSFPSSLKYLIKAQITLIEKSHSKWFDETSFYYTKAIHLDESYDNCFAFDLFLQTYNQR